MALLKRKTESIRRVDHTNHTVQVYIGYLLLLILVAGCATTSVPTASEVSEVLGGKKTVILLRLTVDIDGNPSEPFDASLADDNVGLAFITGDRVRRLEFYRSPSDQARQDGWIYLVEDPGTYYLAVQPPRDRDAFSYQFQFRSAPRWRIDALAGSTIVYAGRLHINAVTEKGFLFTRRTVYDLSRTAVRDEHSLARELAAKSFPDLGSPVTVLMEPLGVPAAGP
jgi:hypothetical protein